MFKSERDYQNHVTKGLRKEWWRIYKIPDVNMQIKPFDIIGVYDWYAIAIELKVCNLKKGLTYEQAYAMLRPNQIWALNTFKEAWWDSNVRVYNIAEDKEYRFGFKYLEDNQVEL